MSSLRHSLAFQAPPVSAAAFGDFTSEFNATTLTGLYRRRVKRGLDLALSVALAPVALPLVFGLAALIRLDGGAAFYGQTRVGRGGRLFTCWKLRTMVEDADGALERLCAQDPALAREWALNQKLARDPRITRLGRFLRATSLDELPQLWNVMIGQMSVVGPRPFTPDQHGLYNAAGGQAYYALRPGLTGLWQVLGRSASSFAQRVEYDETYARNLGFWSDLALLARTSLVVLRGTGK